MRICKRILVIRLDRIGDVILSTPVVRALRKAYPGGFIGCMVRPYCREIVEGNPYIDEAIIYDKESGLQGLADIVTRLRREKFDLALILHPTRRTHLIAFLAGIPERVGYDAKWGGLLTKRVPHAKQFGLKHERDYTLDLVRYIGVEPHDTALDLPVKAASERKVEDLLAKAGVRPGEPLVVLHPGASCPSKRWPADRFAKAGAALASRRGARVVVVAGPGEKAAGDSVAAAIGDRAINLAGSTTVADLASLFRRASLVISNDSGPVHIACAVGTPVIAIFGRNDRGLSPLRWGPTGPRDVVLHKEVGCEVCLAHRCARGFACLAAVTVDEVVAAALRILGR